MPDPTHSILLTGATGYVGGRLLRALERAGRRVRCLVRSPSALQPPGAEATEVVQGDVLDRASLHSALKGTHTAYYLVHSMGSVARFQERDRRAAQVFAAAAREAGLGRIIYLGGLGHGRDLSRHLASRQEVGRILRESGIPTVELRSSIIIGPGSLSFEMVRALVERLPVMVTPRWVRTRAQPIAIDDVIAYLIAALELQVTSSQVFEIGGADEVSYMDLMKEYGRQRGLRRILIPVPVLTPRLSSLWLGLVTPLQARVGRMLIEGVRNETIVSDKRAIRAFDIRPRSIAQAIADALSEEDEHFARMRWSEPATARRFRRRWGGVRSGSRLVDSRSADVSCPPAEAFRPIRQMISRPTWHCARWLWELRGLIDVLVGGVGTRRKRRDSEQLAPGNALDFWRVEALEAGRLLRLAAETRLPGRAWLQFEVDGHESGSTVRQTAIFDPVGTLGLLYWYATYPVHDLVFSCMLRAMVRAMGPEHEVT